MFDPNFYMGPLHYLKGFAPTLVAQAVGIIIVIVMWRRAPKAARLLLVTLLLAIVLRAGWPFFIEGIMRLAMREAVPLGFVDFIMMHGHWIPRLGIAACWVVIVLAAMGWRSAGATHGVAPINAPGHLDATQTVLPERMAGMNVRRMSKGFYLGSFIAALVGMWVLLIPGYALMLDGGDEEAMMALGFMCGAWIVMIYLVVVIAFMVYRMWSALQGGVARTTPGKAVGFLFIPLFNLYWIFQVYWGWTVDYNKTASQLGMPGPRAPEGLAMTVCILAVCSVVPVVGILASLVNIVLMIVLVNSVVNGVNALAAVVDTAQGHVVAERADG